MTDTEDSRTTNQKLSLEDGQNLATERLTQDEIYMRSIHHGRLVCDVINDDNEKSENHFNRWREITLLPTLKIIANQELVPLKTCERLMALKYAIEQEGHRKGAGRNYMIFDDELGGVESVDFNSEPIPDGVYDFSN